MQPSELLFRALRPSDFQRVVATMQSVYAEQGAIVTIHELQLLMDLYPGGQLVCLCQDRIAAVILSRVVSLAEYQQPHIENVLRDTRLYVSDTRDGDSALILDFFVEPSLQQLKVGKQIHQFLEQQVFAENFVTLIGTSRITGYQAVAHQLRCEEYVAQVLRKERHDPVLSFHLRNGVTTGGIIERFNEEDRESCGYGVMVFLKNPRHDPSLPIYPARTARLATWAQGEVDELAP